MTEGKRLLELTRDLPAVSDVPCPNIAITGVTADSRSVQPGYLFVAVKGVKADGHTFVADAVKRGAVAIVVDRHIPVPDGTQEFVVEHTRPALAAIAHSFYDKPSSRLKVIGVTGTNGKSTTCYVMRSILEAAGHRCGLLGTVENYTGRGSARSSMTTPDATTLHALLRDMVCEGLTHAVMEVSSHALDQRRADCVSMAAAVFTNLTGDHLDYHKTMEAYRRAKGRLFRGLSADAFAVLNADDAASLTFETKAHRVWYGLGARGRIEGASSRARKLGPYVTAEELRLTLDGSRFVLRVCGARGGALASGSVEIQLPLVGRHNVYNALGAASAALALGIGMEDVRKGLQSARPVPGRLDPVLPSAGERAARELGFHVLVDYAHTHDGLECVLSTLRPLAPRRLIVVFGAGGDRDKTKRPKMGHAVERWADLAWITSDNPRSEDPNQIIEDICAGIGQKGKFRKVENRRAAIEQAMSEAGPGDLVVIAGKGHETQQICRDRVFEFDDRKVAQEVLDQRMRRARLSA